MATVDLIPDETDFEIAQDNDKVITAGPFKRGGVIVPRTGKRLRYLIKKSPRATDASAIVDLDSVADPLRVLGVGADATGVWVVDIRDILPAVGPWYYRVDLTGVASLSVDREIVGLGKLVVRAV